jgi:hypothetical protein
MYSIRSTVSIATEPPPLRDLALCDIPPSHGIGEPAVAWAARTKQRDDHVVWRQLLATNPAQHCGLVGSCLFCQPRAILLCALASAMKPCEERDRLYWGHHATAINAPSSAL